MKQLGIVLILVLTLMTSYSLCLAQSNISTSAGLNSPANNATFHAGTAWVYTVGLNSTYQASFTGTPYTGYHIEWYIYQYIDDSLVWSDSSSGTATPFYSGQWSSQYTPPSNLEDVDIGTHVWDAGSLFMVAYHDNDEVKSGAPRTFYVVQP
jgi:hypothetical protein